MANKELHVVARFMIGIRYDGREQLLADRRIDDLVDTCLRNQWTRIDGVTFDATRFTVYRNPYPIVTGILPDTVPVFDEDDEDYPGPR